MLSGIILISKSVSSQNIYSFSYQNVSRNNGGGTLEKGDTIEVRALVKVEGTTKNFYYIDTIRTGTKYLNNSLKLITNEGLLFKGTYTNTGGDDLGVYDISGGKPRLRVNIGTGAGKPVQGTGAMQFGNNSGGGTVTPGDKPKFYGKTLFIVAYRLVITAEFDETIYLKGNYYYDSSYTKGGNTITEKKLRRFDYAGIKVVRNQDLCNNFSSASFTAESDFGLGSIQNRALEANVPGYNKVNLNGGDPGDGNYSIVNNTSANGTTNNNGPFRPNVARVFGVWDIIGDHTGAANQITGNSPITAGDKGGYMLVVNSAFPTGEAYRDQIKNVCPNTYYEFSAWIRNICGKCGIDSNGVSQNMPGVQPNLAFTINDIDYYTTGSIPYTQEWVKRGFIYRTGPTETEFSITIKNNAPGGGGNDWVLDDIKLATCYPNLIMNPSDTARLCANYPVHLSDTVKSYFNNYNNFCWQKSADGINWVNTNNCSSKVPEWKEGLWVYVADTVFTVVPADSGMHYRLKVATTSDNLEEEMCAVDNSQKVFLQVYNMRCLVLEEKFLDFEGKIVNNFVELKWTARNLLNLDEYEIESSYDGIHFKRIGVVPASQGQVLYKWVDLQRVGSTAYYRLKLISRQSRSKTWSKIILLSVTTTTFKISTSNPFEGNLKLNIFLPFEGEMEIQLINISGKTLLKSTVPMGTGNSQYTLPNSANLPKGWYILRTSFNGAVFQNRLFKSN